MRCFGVFCLLLSGSALAGAAAKPHVVSLGPAVQTRLFIGPAEDKTVEMTVHALYIHSKLKEFTTGPRHEMTDRLFVVQRAFRINDALPDDPKKQPRWLWQRGG